MKATIRWVDDVMFVGEADSGHAVVIDGPPDAGGRNAGFRPMELVLTGVGACTAFDVVSILRKARQAVEDCRVEVEAERAVNLSAEKYCSATLMLRESVAITHAFEIAESASSAD